MYTISTTPYTKPDSAHCSLLVIFQCTLPVLLRCTLSVLLRCTLSVLIQCTLSVLLQCTLSVLLQCTLSVLIQCTLSILLQRILKSGEPVLLAVKLRRESRNGRTLTYRWCKTDLFIGDPHNGICCQTVSNYSTRIIQSRT